MVGNKAAGPEPIQRPFGSKAPHGCSAILILQKA
ncbi:uncharacterized protein METZ01_LOCUS411851, partial [marine metagenome]